MDISILHTCSMLLVRWVYPSSRGMYFLGFTSYTHMPCTVGSCSYPLALCMSAFSSLLSHTPPPNLPVTIYHNSVQCISGHSGALMIPVSLCYNHSEMAQSSKRCHLPSTEASDALLDSEDFNGSSDSWIGNRK